MTKNLKKRTKLDSINKKYQAKAPLTKPFREEAFDKIKNTIHQLMFYKGNFQYMKEGKNELTFGLSDVLSKANCDNYSVFLKE